MVALHEKTFEVSEALHGLRTLSVYSDVRLVVWCVRKRLEHRLCSLSADG